MARAGCLHTAPNHSPMPLAYLGLGSNLQDPPAQLRAALERLGRQPDLRLLRRSALYRSTALPQPGRAGMPAQPDYCNAVCSIETALAPPDLMALLLAMEREAGRVRDGLRWGPRVLDLDLLHVEGVALDTPALRLPHPEIASRNFVLVPLAEIAPALEIPGLGRIADLAQQAGRAGLALL